MGFVNLGSGPQYDKRVGIRRVPLRKLIKVATQASFMNIETRKEVERLREIIAIVMKIKPCRNSLPTWLMVLLACSFRVSTPESIIETRSIL